MDTTIYTALTHDHLADISTTGRRSATIHRFEIWFHFLDQQIYLTGKPGVRDWYANIVAHPQITFHLKQTVQRAIPALAYPIANEPERRGVLTQLLDQTDYWHALDTWIAGSPLVRIELQL